MARTALLVGLAALTFQDAAIAQPARTARVDPRTASIRGRVTTADTAAPVRGAEVRLSRYGQYTRLATTNGEGRFELIDLPSGAYNLVVSRTGFISLQFGQRRPFAPPTTIDLADGERFTANVALIRGGAIYGRVLDQFGEPATGTRVQALRSRMVQGRRRLQSVGPADQADDTGAFRLYGLPPGDYFVAASGGPVDAIKRDPPIYYPGTPSFAEAHPVTLGVGADATADIQMMPVRNARVSGVVLNASGAPAPAMVNLHSEAVSVGPTIAAGPAALMLHADAAPDGTFIVDSVPPGPYVLTATLFPGAGQPPSPGDGMFRVPETVVMPIVVTGEDVTGLTLVTRPGGTLNGRFVADAGVAGSLPAGLRLTMRSSHAGGMEMTGGVGDREEFLLRAMAGPFHFQVEGVPEDWAVQAILLNDTDVTDETIDLKGETANVRVVMTDRLTSLSGRVQSREGTGGQGIVVFPDDETRWKWPSRYVRTARTDGQGRFLIRGLPPGERYLVAAFDDLQDGDEQDPDFLDRSRKYAISVSLREGEQQSVKLEVGARQ
jgi:hypothetical protein